MNIEQILALRVNCVEASFRPFTSTKLVNLGVKIPKTFSPGKNPPPPLQQILQSLRGDECKKPEQIFFKKVL